MKNQPNLLLDDGYFLNGYSHLSFNAESHFWIIPT